MFILFTRVSVVGIALVPNTDWSLNGEIDCIVESSVSSGAAQEGIEGLTEVDGLCLVTIVVAMSALVHDKTWIFDIWRDVYWLRWFSSVVDGGVIISSNWFS
jgi:hypothetical protein